MATQEQVHKLRRKIQDFYNKRTGEALTASDQAFKDDEIEDILDDCYVEVSDGLRNSSNATPFDTSMAMLLSRADAIIQIAQDESRRVRWQTNNEIVDPTMIARNLIAAARELRIRYENTRKRQLDEKVGMVENRPSGGIAKFNSGIRPHSERNFNNSDVQRNRPNHY